MRKTKKYHYKFFCNKKCEYYPCHRGLDEINCLFCYCPLFGFDCGGNYIITPDNKKDCSNCLLPHINYDFVIDFLLKRGVLSQHTGNGGVLY